MTDFNSLRSRRKLDLQNAMNNVRKDLYDWKSTNKSEKNISKTVIIKPSLVRLKSLDDFSNSESSKQNENSNQTSKSSKNQYHSSSLLARPQSDKSSRSSNQKGPVTFDKFINDPLEHNKKKHDRPPPIEFLKSSSSKLNFENEEKMYLNSDRKRPLRLRMSPKEIENELDEKLNQKDLYYVQELDLSQLNLKKLPDIEKFRCLKVLDASCNQITILENLDLKNLLELLLYGNRISNIQGLESLSELQSLQLQTNQIKHLKNSLVMLKKLEYLRLDYNELEAINCHEIVSCNNLIYLNISHNKIQSLKFLNYLPNLEELDASYLYLKDLNDIDPTRCKKLYEIDFSNNKLKDDQLGLLEDLSNLNVLKVSGCDLNSVKNVSKIKSLKILDVSCNRIEEIEKLVDIVNLENLNVSKNKISKWTQIEILSQLTNLCELECNENPVFLRKTFHDVTSLIPHLNFLNQIEIKNNESTHKIDPNKNSTLLNIDMMNFEQEMEIFNQNFLSRYNEINNVLNSIDLIPIKNIPNSIMTIKNPVRVESAGSMRKSAKNRLKDALQFSKNLNN